MTSQAQNSQGPAPAGGFLTPMRRRWVIIAIVFSAMVLSYIDRVTVSFLEKEIKGVFGVGNYGYAWIVNAFIICYALMYPVSGWLIDRFGGGRGVRRFMLGSIVTWSLACAGAAFTRAVLGFGALRAVLGLSETMVNTVQIRVVTEWFPRKLRATANSICSAGGIIGMVIAAPLLVGLKEMFDWRMAFIVPGVMGLVVAALWRMFYRNPPAEVLAENIGVSSTSGEPAFAWSQLWKTRTLWGVILVRFISDPVWYFILFWLPGYLKTAGFTEKQVGLFGWIPFVLAAAGGIGAAMLSDCLVRGGMAPLRARKVVLAGAACFMPLFALAPHVGNPFCVVALFCLACAVCQSWLCSMGVVIAEALPARNVAGVLGISAGFGAGGSVLFNTFAGKAFDTAGPVVIFTIMGGLHLVAAVILWTMPRKETPPEA